MKVDAPPTDTAPPAVLVQNYSTSMYLVACPVKHLASVQQFPHRPQLFLLVYTVKEARWRRSQERGGGSIHGVSGQASSHDWVLGRQPKSFLGALH